MTVIRTVGVSPKRCVPYRIPWGWFRNRRPRGRRDRG